MSIALRTVKSEMLTRTLQSLYAAVAPVLIAACAAIVLSSGAAAQTVPNAVIYTSTLLTNINGNAGHVAANNLGDTFYVSQSDNVAYWLKRGTTTPVPLVTGLSGGRNIEVDA